MGREFLQFIKDWKPEEPASPLDMWIAGKRDKTAVAAPIRKPPRYWGKPRDESPVIEEPPFESLLQKEAIRKKFH